MTRHAFDIYIISLAVVSLATVSLCSWLDNRKKVKR